MSIEKEQISIKVISTQATFLMWLDCRALGLTQDKLVNFFLYEAKLGLNDGTSFGRTGEGFMRLNIGTSKEVLELAITKLLSAYRRIN